MSQGSETVMLETRTKRVINPLLDFSGVVVIGLPTGLGSDAYYRHIQTAPLTTWVINHNLGKFPAVTIMDSANNEVEATIIHDSVNSCRAIMSAAFGGTATCN